MTVLRCARWRQTHSIRDYTLNPAYTIGQIYVIFIRCSIRLGIFRLICETCKRFDTDCVHVYTIIVAPINDKMTQGVHIFSTKNNQKYSNYGFRKNSTDLKKNVYIILNEAWHKTSSNQILEDVLCFVIGPKMYKMNLDILRVGLLVALQELKRPVKYCGNGRFPFLM